MNARRLPILVLVLLATSAGLALAASSPTVRTGSAASVSTTSAELTGTVNPNGAKTTYYFAWGSTRALGNRTAAASAGSGTKAKTVKTKLTGLTPGSPYYFQLVASNSSGTGSGTLHSFRTSGNPPPGAQTGGPAAVGRYSVTLTGVVYPQNQATTWTFEYGKTTTYTSQSLPQTISGGSAPVSVQATITGLEPGTIFHYRLVASHSGVYAQAGSDAFFETLPVHRPSPHLRVSIAPHSRRHTPATFTVRGRVRRPSSTPASLACTGSARISFLLGRRTVRTALTPLQPNCTFAWLTTFSRLPGHGRRGRIVHLSVRVRFDGNPYLAPGTALNQSITL